MKFSKEISYFIFLLFIGLQSTETYASDVKEASIFQEFIEKYKKDYTNGTAEYQLRFKIFKESLKRHTKLNEQRTRTDDALYGITRFSDLTKEEFQKTVLGPPVPVNSVRNSSRKKFSSQNLLRVPQAKVPKIVDMRTSTPPILTSVKNQESCGGCWAFSIIECMETQYAMKNKVLNDLSPQQLIDCSGDAGNAGCKGGNINSTLRWLNKTQTQIVTEKSYPFEGKTQNCGLPSMPEGKVYIKNFSCESYIDREEEMVSLLATHGPLTVAVDATAWQDYLGGIIQHHCYNHFNNHAVQIVGYNKAGPVPYYIVRNSWGKSWGLDGYLKIKIGGDLCGISNQVGALVV